MPLGVNLDAIARHLALDQAAAGEDQRDRHVIGVVRDVLRLEDADRGVAGHAPLNHHLPQNVKRPGQLPTQSGGFLRDEEFTRAKLHGNIDPLGWCS
jgi:hypothetical protein